MNCKTKESKEVISNSESDELRCPFCGQKAISEDGESTTPCCVEIETKEREGLDVLEDWLNHQLDCNDSPWVHIHDLIITIEKIREST